MQRHFGAEFAPPLNWVPSPHGFVIACRLGLGWGCNPDMLVADDMERGSLVELVPGASLDIPLFWQVSRLPSGLLKALGEAVASTAHMRAIDGAPIRIAVAERPAGSLLSEAGWAPLGMSASALALFLLAAFSFRSSRRAREEEGRLREADEKRRAADREYHETQREFTEILQITRDEDEAYELLRRYLERSVAGSSVLVLNRNNSHDRLEPVPEPGESPPLAATPYERPPLTARPPCAWASVCATARRTMARTICRRRNGNSICE